MGAFEFSNVKNCNDNEVQDVNQAAVAGPVDTRRVKDECIIAAKVYDSCRQQDCLTPAILGPARAAECICIGDERIPEGDIIDPPENAAAVTIDRLRIKKIIVVDKEPNPFKPGYWDIDLKYVFEYRLTFREADGSIIAPVLANSIFNKKVTLFGSVGSNLVISTDLLKMHCDSTTLDAEPFINKGYSVVGRVQMRYISLTQGSKVLRKMNM